jgi:hypothetical protein
MKIKLDTSRRTEATEWLIDGEPVVGRQQNRSSIIVEGGETDVKAVAEKALEALAAVPELAEMASSMRGLLALPSVANLPFSLRISVGEEIPREEQSSFNAADLTSAAGEALEEDEEEVEA